VRGKERPSESFQTALKRVGIKKGGWLSATPKHTHIKRKEKSFNIRELALIEENWRIRAWP